MVSLPTATLDEFAALCAGHHLPLTRLGEVTGNGFLEFQGHFALPMDEIRQRWTAPIPAAMHA